MGPLLQLLLLRVVVVVGARDMSASAGITSSPLSGCSASCSAAASASGILGAGSPSTAGQEAPRRGRGMMAWVPNKSAGQQIKAYQEIECVIGVTYNTKKKGRKKKKKRGLRAEGRGCGAKPDFYVYIRGSTGEKV